MDTFSALLATCAGNSPVTGEFPVQRPLMRIFYVFFDLCLNKRLSKQSWGWWFETPSSQLWHHCNVFRANSLPLGLWHYLQTNSEEHEKGLKWIHKSWKHKQIKGSVRKLGAYFVEHRVWDICLHSAYNVTADFNLLLDNSEKWMIKNGGNLLSEPHDWVVQLCMTRHRSH